MVIKTLASSKPSSLSREVRALSPVHLFTVGDEDGDDPNSCRIWLYPLRQATWSSSWPWLCNRQNAVGQSEQGSAGEVVQMLGTWGKQFQCLVFQCFYPALFLLFFSSFALYLCLWCCRPGICKVSMILQFSNFLHYFSPESGMWWRAALILNSDSVAVMCVPRINGKRWLALLLGLAGGASHGQPAPDPEHRTERREAPPGIPLCPG